MKVKHIIEQNLTTTGDDPEGYKISAVTKRPTSIRSIENPSEAVQMAAVKKNIYVLDYIEHPTYNVVKYAVTKDCGVASMIDPKFLTPDLITQVLTDPRWTIFEVETYNNLVRNIFQGNNLLINKWIRYGEKMRIEQ
jgi:hypothetical protein